MKLRTPAISLFLLGIFIPSFLLAQQSTNPMGFTDNNSRAQLALEKKFSEKLKTSDIDAWIKRLSAFPHHVGSPYGKKNMFFLDSLFKAWGYQTKIHTYYVLFPTPKTRKLELIAPHPFKASLTEDVLSSDPYTSQTDLQLPPYNAFSADGDVTGELVFVNYGLPEDYEKLAEKGISVEGKIVIVKYGHSWRGIKPRLAQEHGAIGCLIYPDPQDDGYSQGEVYPKGPFKNSSTVQRGSITNLTVYPGDPLTPGYAATKDAKRLKISEAEVIKKIPVLPISYGDAQPLLEAMNGPVAPASWAGSLPITYHLGGGAAKVHLQLAFNWDITPIYNLTALLEGKEVPDQWIIRGNHQDAWVNGAADPISGLSAELAEAQAIHELTLSGWQPKRSILYCVWDGEEPALFGSTEWVEDRQEELKEKAVVYINTDGNGRGFLHAGGSHSLEKFFSEVAYAVEDPETGISVAQRRLDRDKAQGQNPDGFHLSALGSGSDYSPFLQHTGIAALNLAFGGEDPGGEYHSMYDTYTFFKRFKDPGFHYEVALAKVAGIATLRLANSDLLPFDFLPFQQTVEGYSQEVEQLARKKQTDANVQNQLLSDRVYKNAADPTKSFQAPKALPEVPYFNFSPLKNVLSDLQKTALNYRAFYNQLLQQSDQNAIKAFNNQIFKSERQLLSPDGLPKRPWFKHLIYAPGYFTGYGVKTLPGVRESIEEQNYDQVNNQIEILSEQLNQLDTFLNHIMK